jgi:hypothetical protein
MKRLFGIPILLSLAFASPVLAESLEQRTSQINFDNSVLVILSSKAQSDLPGSEDAAKAFEDYKESRIRGRKSLYQYGKRFCEDKNRGSTLRDWLTEADKVEDRLISETLKAGVIAASVIICPE